MYINKKDLIRINQEIGESGGFVNEGSLDFAVSLLKQKKSWLFELSYLLRGLLVDHAFRDGNKRTAFAVTVLYFEHHNLKYNEEKLVRTIKNIEDRGVSGVYALLRLIKRCYL